jgi:plasmid stabilization system protein ParE
MPGAEVRLSESALLDLENLQDWYEEQGVPDVGKRFLIEIFKHIEVLRDHPEGGRIVPEFGQPNLRELIHPPFRIIYRIEQSRLQIVRVWRSERLLQLPPVDGPV